MITGNPKPDVPRDPRSHPASKFQLSKVGFPIRKSRDQRLFAPSPSLSQRTTSFIASYRQGIHQMPLGHLIALICNAHPCSNPHPRPGEERLTKAEHSAGWHCNRKTRSHKTNPYPDGTHAPSEPLHTTTGRNPSLRSWDAPATRRWHPGLFPLHDVKKAASKRRRWANWSGNCCSSNMDAGAEDGGACRDRTDDLKLAKLPLSQLS